MSGINDIEKKLFMFSNNIASIKITARKTAQTDYLEFLQDTSVINFLKLNVSLFPKLLLPICESLRHDVDKILQDQKKKGLNVTVPFTGSDLFLEFIKLASDNKNSISFKKLITFFNSEINIFYHSMIIRTIVDIILNKCDIRKSLDLKDWESLYLLVKSFLESKKNQLNHSVVECLTLIVKWITTYHIPINTLRNSFDFIQRILSNINESSSYPLQHAVIELLTEFCLQNADDNRISCCKLGENIFSLINQLYLKRSRDGDFKQCVIKFILLQISIHHPKGGDIQHAANFDVSFDSWLKPLKFLHSLILSDVKVTINSYINYLSIKENEISYFQPYFVQLFVEVSKLVFDANLETNKENYDPEITAKRLKIENIVTLLISNIRLTESWTWISLTYSLIDSYPEILTEDDFFHMLTIFENFMKFDQKRDLCFKHHIYKALIVLEKIEWNLKHLTNKDKYSNLWFEISQSLMIALNSNPNEKEIHYLLQRLLKNRSIIKQEDTNRYFNSVIGKNITNFSLTTASVIFEESLQIQYDTKQKHTLIKWILSNKKWKEIDMIFVSKILFCCVLKEWQNCDSHIQNRTNVYKKQFEDIEKLYNYVLFEEFLVDDKRIVIHDRFDINSINENLLSELIQMLVDLNSTEEENDCDIEHNLRFCILVLNLLNLLMKYMKFEENSLSTLFEIFEQRVLKVFQFQIEEKKYKDINTIPVMTLIELLFSIKNCDFITQKFREIVPPEFLQMFFTILASEIKGDYEFDLKELAGRIIIQYSITNDVIELQQMAIETLLRKDYEFELDLYFDLSLTFLETISKLNIKSLSESLLFSINKLFQNMNAERRNSSFGAFKLLTVFQSLYPLFVKSSIQNEFLEMLLYFYQNIASYDSKVIVKFIECIQLIFKNDSFKNMSCWDNQSVIFTIPKFLCHDYQLVRFAAIRVVLIFFDILTKTRGLEEYHLQEIMFSKIDNSVGNLFETEENSLEKQQNDKELTRSLSYLHLYGGIILTSNLWIKKALVIVLKNLKLKRHFITRWLSQLSKKLNFGNELEFIEKYLIALYKHWKHDIDNFPFFIYNCTDKYDFYTKYSNKLAPHIIRYDSSDVLNNLNQDTLAENLSYCIAAYADKTSLQEDKVYMHLTQNNFNKEIIQKYIYDILLNLTEFICDAVDFKSTFQENVNFTNLHYLKLDKSQFILSLKFINSIAYDKTDVILYLLEHDALKLYTILLQIQLKIDTSQFIEEKLKYFHSYQIINDLWIDSMINQNEKNLTEEFFIRNLVYTILNFISKNNFPMLQLVSCKYLKSVLRNILPKMSESLGYFYIFIVSRLNSLSTLNAQIGELCKEIIIFLIIEQKSTFIIESIKMESFLSEYTTKQSLTILPLKDRIHYFVNLIDNIEDINECKHALNGLRKSLCNPRELEEIVKVVRNGKKHSMLHDLICCLIKLTYSSDSKVSKEALLCLGEIGPCDLGTLVLKNEESIPDTKLSPIELLFNQTINLLAKYIVDINVNTKQCAANALLNILNTKEGYKVFSSQIDYGFNVVPYSYLRIFISPSRKRTMFNIKINKSFFLRTITREELWSPLNLNCHKKWITNLTTTLLSCFEEATFFASMISIANWKVDFCELLLPLIIYTILYQNHRDLNDIISDKINLFFEKHWNVTVLNKQDDEVIANNKCSLQCMLSVVDFLRLQNLVRTKKLTKNLEIDFLKVANAAQFCSSPFFTILYCELWCRTKNINQSLEKDNQLNQILKNVDETTQFTLQNILRKAYKSIGEMDALNGCGSFYLTNLQNCIEHYKDLGDWERVAFHTEKALISDANTSFLPLIKSLKDAGFLYVPNKIDQTNDIDCMWQLSQWEHDKKIAKTYSEFKFETIKSLYQNDEFNFIKNIQQMQNCITNDLHSLNLNTTNHFYSTLSQLQSLKELDDISYALKHDSIESLLKSWTEKSNLNNFQYIEPIKTQRNLFLTSFSAFKTPQLQNQAINLLLQFASFARIESKYLVAYRTLSSITQLGELPPDILTRIKLERAQLALLTENFVEAEYLIQQVCNDESNIKLHAIALKIKGEWLVARSEESIETVIEDHFKKALNLWKNSNDDAESKRFIVETYLQLAKFADQKYQQVMTRIKSDIYQKKLENVNKVKETVRACSVNDNTHPDLKRSLMIKTKQCALDEHEINEVEHQKDKLLKVALKYYLLTLIYSEYDNVLIFRFVSLLLENRSTILVQHLFKSDVYKIPTYKFITILPQLMPHISSSTANDAFCTGINHLIEKCAKEHPHHTLPLILSLANADKDRLYTKSTKDIVNDSRTRNANLLLHNLKKHTPITDLIKKMELLCNALIELAYFKEGESSSSKLKIKMIKDFDNVLLPTHELPVNVDQNYEEIVGIHSFDERYHNVGGINEPKRITCRGTDGKKRTQLIKGRDDLRQDAVMQQVFTIMNNLLFLNKHTRNLNIRTYKIVPLSMRSGILEWVDNSLTFGEYLVEDGGAHQKYRPMDKTPKRCRAECMKLATLPMHSKLAAYREICDNIQPVFHNFFLHQFPQATIWYERRRAYIHSVATSSMCGYILGIGDRHVNNILIDNNTGEVIHIDFGIAFEQGKILPTPEMVPFRLTRDVVDGMGVSGVDGLFTKSCEKTLQVLRDHEQTIMTILEVLLYDPLYDWTVSSVEANRRQFNLDELDESSINEVELGVIVNVTAERALLGLRAKLQGLENGMAKTVESQVRCLIQEATKPENLCRMFHGWQSYL